MKIRTTLLLVGLALVLLSSLHISLSQEPVQVGIVRGHFSSGDDIWRANDFGWFYYDLDSGQGTEQLNINLDGRTAERSHIIYSSQSWPRQFEYEPWGIYQAVAFFGKLYLAGYPESNFTGEVSALGKGDLREVLLDEKSTHTLTYNSSLPLRNGYILSLKEVSEENDEVDFVLLKNNKVMHEAVVDIGGTYVYKIGDVPVILIHLADAMSGKDSGFAEVDGIFEVGDEPNFKLFEGAKFGNLELSDLSETSIKLKNNRTITLTKNSLIPLTANLVLVVVNDSKLIYYPEGGLFDYGLHEIRGPTFNENSIIPVQLGEYNSSVIARWNSANYTGFYYDPFKNVGFETLVLYGVRDRTVLAPSMPKIINNTVLQDGFQYTSFLQPKEFEFSPWGHYFVISFLGSQWFAGYDSSLEGRKASYSLLEHEQLGRMLTDMEIRGIILAGNYTLAEGYEVRIRDVEKDRIFIQLFKDEKLVDSSVVKSNSTYIYKKDLGDVKDMPIILMHIGNVFSDGDQRFATIDGIFQISDQFVFPVDPGRGLEEMEIVSTQPSAIVMVNPDYINLNQNSNIALSPAMNLKVADNESLRYYLYNVQYVVPKPKLVGINYSKNVSSSNQANFFLDVQAGEIKRVTADILDSTNRTVYARDLTELGLGAGDRWVYSWQWNATTLHLTDDGSLVLDASGNPVPGLLYLDKSSRPLPVGIKFDASGRIANIVDSKSIYYVSPKEYESLNTSLNYDAMFRDDKARKGFIKIQPGISIVRFYDIVNGKLILARSNHTLTGSLQELEPHVERIGAEPGRYELRPRIENAIDALSISDAFYLNVSSPESIFLGSAQAIAGETVSVPVVVRSSSGNKRIDISYDPEIVEVIDISLCNKSQKVDQKVARINLSMSAGCAIANLTFIADKANATTDLKVVGVSGFHPEKITNGSIVVSPETRMTKKSDPSGFILGLAALILAVFCRRKK